MQSREREEGRKALHWDWEEGNGASGFIDWIRLEGGREVEVEVKKVKKAKKGGKGREEREVREVGGEGESTKIKIQVREAWQGKYKR